MEDKNVIIDVAYDDTIIATTLENRLEVDKIFGKSSKDYMPNNEAYSPFLKGESTNEEVTYETLNSLKKDCRNDVEKIIKISSIVENEITSNGLIGKAYEAIETNLNTSYKLVYQDFSDNKSKNKQLEKTKTIIDRFNEIVGISYNAMTSILNTYATGNTVLYLRGNSNKGWSIDTFPLKVAIVSPYRMGNDPVVLIDIKYLEGQIKKGALKNKKGKALFFKDVEEEIKNNYPDEVYKAFKDKEKYAVLEPSRTYIMRINNMNKKYGLTPIFKALEDNLILKAFKEADKVNANARSKKILVQYLSDKLLEQNRSYGYQYMTFAHKTLMEAWKQPIVVVTPPACVSKIEYVEPKTELTDPKILQERQNNVLSALGINFTSGQNGNSVSSANISLKQLMNVINRISIEYENAINKFYKVVLDDNKISMDFLPKLDIIDSELMDIELRKTLAEFMFNRLNASYETSYKILGFDVNDEKQKRINENDNEFENIFMPHQTASTFSSKNVESGNEKESGRPADEKSNNPSKQEYDVDYNKNERQK